MKKTVVLGIGNLLFSDEGIGIHVIKEVMNWPLPEGVEVHDGGTLGILCAPLFEGADTLLLVDSVESSEAPGTVLKFNKDDIMLNRVPIKLSPHQIGIQETLLISELRGKCPNEVVFYGAVPKSYESMDKLTAEGEKAKAQILSEIKQYLIELNGA